MRLPSVAYPRAERSGAEPYVVASSVAARHQEPPLERASDAPSDELVDIYAVALIAVPLALFLRWLWP